MPALRLDSLFLTHLTIRVNHWNLIDHKRRENLRHLISLHLLRPGLEVLPKDLPVVDIYGLFQHCVNLEDFHAEMSTIVDDATKDYGALKLNRLSLVSCQWFNDESDQLRLLNRFPQLSHLGISIEDIVILRKGFFSGLSSLDGWRNVFGGLVEFVDTGSFWVNLPEDPRRKPITKKCYLLEYLNRLEHLLRLCPVLEKLRIETTVGVSVFHDDMDRHIHVTNEEDVGRLLTICHDYRVPSLGFYVLQRPMFSTVRNSVSLLELYMGHRVHLVMYIFS